MSHAFRSRGLGLRLAVLALAMSVCAPAAAGPSKGGNAPPSISGTPQTSVTAGARYAFSPTASDPNGDRLRFSVANKPFWATFDSATGSLAGTPTADQLGIYRDVRITVSDGRNKVSLAPFTVTVQPGTQTVANRAPTISGTPATSVTAGQAYSFRPTATDPDGNLLTFAIANRPAWATFDTKTGTLTGTPASTSVGTYSNVTISASDGSLSSTLAPFAITVAAAAAPPPPVTGSAELSWLPPTTRSDGSVLTNLAGYRVYYGTVRGTYTQRLDLPSPGLTTAVVENLTTGTYYFVTTAYDANGVESGFSIEVSKTIL